jgi:hypothetical protein
MAIEKPMTPVDLPPEEGEIEISVINPDAVTIAEEDGSVSIVLDPELQESIIGPDHDSNFADFMEQADLEAIGSELVDLFESDKQSRKEWSRSYTKGLDLLGMKIEERDQPWPGASGVFHPVLTEACVRFQAQAIMEIFPASGPVRTQIVGRFGHM